MPDSASSNHCLRDWDLADHIRIDDAIALWCGVEPAELAKLNFETQRMSAKRAALVTALRNGRRDSEGLGRRLSTRSGPSGFSKAAYCSDRHLSVSTSPKQPLVATGSRPEAVVQHCGVELSHQLTVCRRSGDRVSETGPV
jgi:hypothetical protein